MTTCRAGAVHYIRFNADELTVAEGQFAAIVNATGQASSRDGATYMATLDTFDGCDIQYSISSATRRA